MSKDQVELLKKHYKKGDRIKLKENQKNFKIGEKGTIKEIDDIGHIHVIWDNGVRLVINYNDFISIS